MELFLLQGRSRKVGEDGVVGYSFLFFSWEKNTMNFVNDHSKPNQSNSSQN